MKKIVIKSFLLIGAFAISLGICYLVTNFLIDRMKVEKTKAENNTKTVVKEVSTKQKSVQQVADIPFNSYNFEYTYTIKVDGNISSLNFKMYVPRNQIGKQDVKVSSLSLKPNKFYTTDNGAIAEYNFLDVENEIIEVSYGGTVKTKTYDLKTAKAYNKNFAPEKDLKRYLMAEKYIEVNDPYIVNLAKKIVGKTREEVVANIYNYVQKNMHYSPIQNIGAKKALELRKGKCVEFAASMVALCRAKGIPARVVAGDILREANTDHAWVEVYYDEYGWVTYDPTAFGTDVFQKNPDGTLEYVENKVYPDIAQADYIQLSMNELEYIPISYNMLPNSNSSATISVRFAVK